MGVPASAVLDRDLRVVPLPLPGLPGGRDGPDQDPWILGPCSTRSTMGIIISPSRLSHRQVVYDVPARWISVLCSSYLPVFPLGLSTCSSDDPGAKLGSGPCYTYPQRVLRIACLVPDRHGTMSKYLGALHNIYLVVRLL